MRNIDIDKKVSENIDTDIAKNISENIDIDKKISILIRGFEEFC